MGIKSLLAIHVISHKNFYNRETYNDIIYSTFCKNLNNYLSRGINIPVFFYDSDNCNIDKNKYEKNIIVVLIEDKLLLDNKKNNLSHITDDKEFSIISFAISKNSHRLSPFFEEKNLVRVYEYKTLEDMINATILDLAHFLCKSLTNHKQKVFISHAKLDGKSLAKDLQHYISTDTKLDSFFDANHIQESSNWADDLEKGVRDSIVLVYYTDLYSSRLWCRKEILFAKKHDRPIVVVNLLKDKEDRSFPYMANVPIMKVSKLNDKNMRLVLKSILVESVRHYYQHLVLDSFLEENSLKEFTPLASAPELLTLINKNECEKFLYPDPPLGNEELEILNSYKKECYFTPLMYLNKNKEKRELKIAISISESQDIEEYNQRLYHLRSFIVELARYLLVFNSKLMYGGDLGYINKEFNFVEILAQLVMSYNEEYKESEIITNYTSYPYYEKILDEHKTNLLDIVEFKDIEPDSKYNLKDIDELEKNYITSETLTKMREVMTKNMDIKIVAGGKNENFAGKYPGILEETYLAVIDEKPVYLVGGFGGGTKKIIDTLKGDISEIFSVEYQLKNPSFKKLYEYYESIGESEKIDYEKMNLFFKEKGIKGLNNGLTIEENEILFESTNLYEIVSLIIKGINNIK
ncbi:TIR domain-containing protein [Arcobacter venerupis]|uniref:TIR domain-containing protein n=1 Tax=Arcobacter venerupis TaxID=1054033 RepID=A0AAE7BA43_9BACT|nr:TIR domain-containing protein [Arcobacter venerupis]QKF66559.1 TIR domain-containing protein [Arcobacter venerupis]RWS49704.1 hypothetical protein CKA56_08265 [Arcobacter venerupis]